MGSGLAPAHPRSIEVALALRAALDRQVVESPSPFPPWTQLARVGRWLEQLRQRLAVAGDPAPPLPPIAVLLIEARLWARYSLDEGKVSLAHVPGPTAGDVIVVTGVPALKALLDGGISAETAISVGILVVTGPSPSALRVEEALRGAFDRSTRSHDHPEER
jgi:hypothetical protein